MPGEGAETKEREATERAFASKDNLSFEMLMEQLRELQLNGKLTYDMLIETVRGWMANNKLTYDQHLAKLMEGHGSEQAHKVDVLAYSELALKESVDFTKSVHESHLARLQQERQHADILFHHYMENNRHTLDMLLWPRLVEAGGEAVILQQLSRMVSDEMAKTPKE